LTVVTEAVGEKLFVITSIQYFMLQLSRWRARTDPDFRYMWS